ncbi:MAG: dethiobiotin synthase [Candidatus Margulisbacteria bacterium]|nr:dethiobiotin synthase [Candidatus Margulisiibacteriota bacterium]MBU1021207.1 dethiobiotin synthase [Candidatus Margulisiibacteriota bacterium]MBU1729813.1 dethiobiotin synthase [Candidatus Margulisiibacteriota bacterium]MBU1955314.1 dethiobiotin synthase [Candidatus Margulisiibacteriota bacterium]
MKQAFFITATDTEAGKTVVAGLLANFLDKKGYQTTTQKWIQTGAANGASDIDLHQEFIGKPAKASALRVPYTFKFPASPHLAADLEKKKIKPAHIKKCFKDLTKTNDYVVVEGIGGALVPYNHKNFVVDIAKDLALPTIIVAPNKLGVINHLLLTIEALKKRQIKILGVIFNQIPKEKKNIQADNPRIVAKVSGVKVLGTLPWTKNKPTLRRAFASIGNKILKEIN